MDEYATAKTTRSLSAVAAGFVVWSLLWIGGTMAVSRIVPDYFNSEVLSESPGVLLLLLGLSVLASVLAGHVTAAIAGFEEIKHATSLSAALMVVGIYVQTASWSGLPVWYHVSFAAFLVPGALLGARIRIERGRRKLEHEDNRSEVDNMRGRS